MEDTFNKNVQRNVASGMWHSGQQTRLATQITSVVEFIKSLENLKDIAATYEKIKKYANTDFPLIVKSIYLSVASQKNFLNRIIDELKSSPENLCRLTMLICVFMQNLFLNHKDMLSGSAIRDFRRTIGKSDKLIRFYDDVLDVIKRVQETYHVDLKNIFNGKSVVYYSYTSSYPGNGEDHYMAFEKYSFYVFDYLLSLYELAPSLIQRNLGDEMGGEFKPTLDWLLDIMIDASLGHSDGAGGKNLNRALSKLAQLQVKNRWDKITLQELLQDEDDKDAIKIVQAIHNNYSLYYDEYARLRGPSIKP